MGNEVLVALDGSEKGERGLAVALALAKLAQASLHLVRVIQPASNRTSRTAELIGVHPMDVAGRTDVERELVGIAAGLTAESNRPVSWEVLEGAADVPGVLIRAAEATQVQLVVMGSGGRTGVKRAILGSVADEVTRRCSKPVVVVPPGAVDLGGRHIELTRVLVPLDGSTLAHKAMELLVDLPEAAHLEFALLAVVHNPQDVPAMRRRLNQAAEWIKSSSPNVTTHVIVHGNAAEAITSATRELLVDMIAMSTRGEGGLRRMVLGSVAQDVVSESEVPVLLLTPTMLAAHDAALLESAS